MYLLIDFSRGELFFFYKYKILETKCERIRFQRTLGIAASQRPLTMTDGMWRTRTCYTHRRAPLNAWCGCAFASRCDRCNDIDTAEHCRRMVFRQYGFYSAALARNFPWSCRGTVSSRTVFRQNAWCECAASSRSNRCSGTRTSCRNMACRRYARADDGVSSVPNGPFCTGIFCR